VLIWAAFLLTAAVAALSADLWLWPASGNEVARAVGVTAAPVTALPSAPPTLPPPTIEITPTTVVTSSITPLPCIPPNDWVILVVQEGNTLYSIARRYGADVDTLMLVNCLNTTTIFVDQRLYVPGSTAGLALPTPFPTSSPAPSGLPEPGASVTAVAGDASAEPTPPLAPTTSGALRVNIPNRYLNIVLLGSDKRPNSGAWRTDSMIIVSVDLDNNVVRLLSIPRDLWVEIPGYGSNRINTADLWGELAKKGGGPERVKQTIYRNLGIPIHYYVRVDFQGFIKIIDTVGGVDIDVDCPLPDIKLTAGVHRMNGVQALRYARSRYSTNDFDRGRRQRKVLMSLWEQALTLDIIPKLPILWRTMADSFQTDLPLDQVINLAYVGVRLKPQRILSRSIGPSQVQGWVTPAGAQVLLPRQDRLRAMLESFYAPQNPTNLDATEKIRVQVLKGTQRKEADQLAAAALRWGGFKVVGTGSADRLDYAQSQIIVYKGLKSHGEEVAALLSLPLTAVQDLTSDPVSLQASKTSDIQVILGQDYNPCNR
jgi:LCP family protein required for cell wall assembly